ncbi:DUF4760 domain-containing protein [Xanthomonas campestris pv. campestris]|nr:DUF4760 domain-containing protein [Xanthomonas campestris pv. campestris]
MNFLQQNPTFPVVTVAAAVAWFSLRSQRHLARAKHTLDFEKEFKDKETPKLRAVVKVLRTRSSDELVQLAVHSPLDHDEVSNLCDVLNVWEGVAIGIKAKVYNEDMLYDAFGHAVIKLFDMAIPFIKARRLATPSVYVRLSWLATRWKVRYGGSFKSTVIKGDPAVDVAKMIKRNERLQRDIFRYKRLVVALQERLTRYNERV